MAPRCMHSAALVASLTAVSMRIASSGSISIAAGTRSTPLVPGMRMSHSMRAMRWRLSCCSASSPEPAAVALRVRQRLGTVGKAVLNARLQVPCDVAHEGLPEVTAHHVAAERQRQPCLGVPPLTEVDPEVQAAVGVGQLALVDQQSRVRPAGHHVLFDL